MILVAVEINIAQSIFFVEALVENVRSTEPVTRKKDLFKQICTEQKVVFFPLLEIYFDEDLCVDFMKKSVSCNFFSLVY